MTHILIIIGILVSSLAFASRGSLEGMKLSDCTKLYCFEIESAKAGISERHPIFPLKQVTLKVFKKSKLVKTLRAEQGTYDSQVKLVALKGLIGHPSREIVIDFKTGEEVLF